MVSRACLLSVSRYLEIGLCRPSKLTEDMAQALGFWLTGEDRNCIGDSLQLWNRPTRSQICWMAAFKSSSCFRNSLSTFSLKRRNSSLSSRTMSKSSYLLGFRDSLFISLSIDFRLCRRGFSGLSPSPSTAPSNFSVGFLSSLGSLLLERSRDSLRMAAMANQS